RVATGGWAGHPGAGGAACFHRGSPLCDAPCPAKWRINARAGAAAHRAGARQDARRASSRRSGDHSARDGTAARRIRGWVSRARRQADRGPVMSAILDIEALTKRFGAMTAVDDVTLSVEEGEIFGLLGPNGAGKSTTLKMLTTLLPPTAGTAQIDGFDLIRQASEVRRVIGYVPQALSADGSLTGYENLLRFTSSARTSTAPRT